MYGHISTMPNLGPEDRIYNVRVPGDYEEPETESTYTEADKVWYELDLSLGQPTRKRYATKSPGKKTTLGKKPRTKTASRRAAKRSRP